jgi:Flp pilus assembly protein TadG
MSTAGPAPLGVAVSGLRAARSRRSRRGSALIEFAITAFLLLTVFFAVLEFCRVVLVYTSVANAARVAARYAVTHGSGRTGTGADGPSGPGADPPQVVAVASTWTKKSMMKSSRVEITVSYPDASNVKGSRVSVKIVYPYDPFYSYLGLSMRLGSIAEGVITN